ncbi:MAG: nucleotidyl transferase AbiEii/AbiGii toxin family protein [Paludibacteraceae bacterium]|nr:nucleotidyl transferase AbiEii/AbiGii toxin family protein [Paludibacteraceae bacterium]
MKWIDYSIDERNYMLQEIATQKQISLNAVEKDWWVTAVLKALFQTPFAPYLLFKGGTSLSKGWQIINRFSEDIDISFGRDWFLEKGFSFAACENKSQRERLRKKSREVVTTEFAEALDTQLKALGISGYSIQAVTEQKTREGVEPIDSDKDPTVLQVFYESIISHGEDYVKPMVKVEISCLSLSEPFAPRPISSMIHERFPEADEDCLSTINTVSPERTFLEKAFLLNEEFQKAKPRTRRMSRHYYDLEKLMDTEFGKKALADSVLYNRIIDHRRKYNTLHYVDYERNRSQNIAFYPPTELLPAFEKDYAEMKDSMVFKDAPAFDDLMKRIAELQERFHNMQYNS